MGWTERGLLWKEIQERDDGEVFLFMQNVSRKLKRGEEGGLGRTGRRWASERASRGTEMSLPKKRKQRTIPGVVEAKIN